MTVLVTGSSGHLGEALVRVLQEQGREVLGLDLREGGPAAGQAAAEAGAMPIVPGRFHEDAPRMAVARLGQRPPPLRRAVRRPTARGEVAPHGLAVAAQLGRDPPRA